MRPPHQQRVIDEKSELDKKIYALYEFIQNNEIFKSLDEKEQDRLNRQHSSMLVYSGILNERISAF